jgi:hypothetical protein
MQDYLSKSKCLASLAVFRELYDNKKDIYGVLSEFLKSVISLTGKHQFNSTEITKTLNDTYDFNIPEAVIKTALGRIEFLTKSEGFYRVNSKDVDILEVDVSKKHTEIKKNNDLIIGSLFKFISSKKRIELTDVEKEKIVHSFCSYFLDDSISQDYTEYVSAFLIENTKNIDFTTKLNLIKEGVLLYTGLRYSSNLAELGSWRTDLTIYIETENLFSFFGYDGSLYRDLFNDFYELVSEINIDSQKKDGRKRIKLKYFVDVQDEINHYFKTAEKIVDGQGIPDQARSAMAEIVNGCRTSSDVVIKKTEFYDFLRKKSIHLDDKSDYYKNDNHVYNIEDLETIKQLKNIHYGSYSSEHVNQYLMHLSFINILREGDNKKGFDSIGFILLTAKTIILKMANHKEIKDEGDVPLATTLNFLTNKFWFKLNKGFGADNFPKSFDLITKAQLALSARLSYSISEKYNEMKKKYKKGELTEDAAKSAIIELRRNKKKPEEINEADVGNVLKLITESKLEDFVREQTSLQNSVTKLSEEDKSSQVKIKEQERMIRKIRIEQQEKLNKLQEEIKDKDQKIQRYLNKEERKNNRNKEIRKWIVRSAWLALIGFFLWLSLWFILNDDKFSGLPLKITGWLGLVISVSSGFYFVYKESKG